MSISSPGADPRHHRRLGALRGRALARRPARGNQKTPPAGGRRRRVPLRSGAARSRHRADLASLLDTLIAASIVLPVEVATTPHYARVRNELRTRGTPIPENDVWIAALARQHGLAVVSRDEHFDLVPQLVRQAW